MLAHRTVWALTGLAALQGCATGDVMDAFTGQPITGAIAAVVSGTCTGTGCQNPATAATNGSGSYVFDAFDPADRQLLRLSPGEETLSIEISKPGYQTVTLHHRPSYLLLIPGQLDSLFTRLNRVYLCALGSPDSDGDSLCDDADAR
ncbi:MAG: carboxypeptidase-like regulatory domain-containing protein [Pseudomonadota bacterium]